MTAHDPRRMLRLLTCLAAQYPSAGYDDATLVLLAEDWAEDLAGYPPDVLAEAVRRARREERFFPNVAVMRDYAGQVTADIRAREQRRALPRPVPDEEAERTRCLNRIAGIRARLGRREAYGGNPSPCRASRAPRGTA